MEITTKIEKLLPKLFELEVTDGNITLYARSIWAAEWSDKMIPHFRFIITNKRKDDK